MPRCSRHQTTATTSQQSTEGWFAERQTGEARAQPHVRASHKEPAKRPSLLAPRRASHDETNGDRPHQFGDWASSTSRRTTNGVVHLILAPKPGPASETARPRVDRPSHSRKSAPQIREPGPWLWDSDTKSVVGTGEAAEPPSSWQHPTSSTSARPRPLGI